MVLIYSLTIFLTGFLVLSIQLAFGKTILPIFGGSPNVWITSLAFFQTLLTLGYGYSYLMQKIFSIKQQAVIHSTLFLITLYFFPIGITDTYLSGEITVPQLVYTLAISIGIPFFLISSGSPLIQQWFSKTKHKDANNPYFLYAASNFGTFIALISFPFFIETSIDTETQFNYWGYLYFFVFALFAICIFFPITNESKNKIKLSKEEKLNVITGKNVFKIILFSFIPSALLSVTTTKLTVDITPIPLFWVIPLALYFFSFSVAFYKNFKLHDNVYTTTLIISCISIFILFSNKHPIFSNIYFSSIVLLSNLTLISIYYHFKIVNLAPNRNQLTLFYLIMSIGGALGGNFVGILSPMIFNDYTEFYIVILLSGLFLVPLFEKEISFKQKIIAPSLYFTLFTGILTYNYLFLNNNEVIYKERTLFGVYKVKQNENKNTNILIHGSTIHGAQYIDSKQNKLIPLTYYTLDNGMSLAINSQDEKYGVKNLGVVGLGAGSLSCSLNHKFNASFYEIDKAIIELANNDKYFSFLSNCPSENQFFLGDARIALPLNENLYDVLVVDAFSSDAIPMHLLTKESFEIYMDKLSKNGILVIHISNRYLDLEKPITNLARHLGLKSKICTKYKKEIEDKWGTGSQVMVLGNNLEHLDECYIDSTGNDKKIWTDKYNSLLSAFR